jgi:ribosomal protein L9
MAQETWTKEQFWAELERLGEDEVRVKLATKIYSDVNERGGLAREWLLRKDQARQSERLSRNEASSREQISIARSAKNAAWAAAIAAIIAIVISIASIAITLLK